MASIKVGRAGVPQHSKWGLKIFMKKVGKNVDVFKIFMKIVSP
jgi:hypothetical protein